MKDARLIPFTLTESAQPITLTVLHPPTPDTESLTLARQRLELSNTRYDSTDVENLAQDIEMFIDDWLCRFFKEKR